MNQQHSRQIPLSSTSNSVLFPHRCVRVCAVCVCVCVCSVCVCVCVYAHVYICMSSTSNSVLFFWCTQAALQPTVVPSIENAAANPQKISTWVQNMADLHRGNPAPKVHYSRKRPSIEAKET